MILNADDFGYDAETNGAILQSLQRWHCSSTTLMANMPGFEEASGLAREHGLVGVIGVHWTVTEGFPLTDGIRACRLFCDTEGRFCLSRKQRVVRLSRQEEEALAAELRAQVARCRAHGIYAEHADTHRHVHEEWGILSVVIRVCRSEGIRKLRIARNMGASAGIVRSLYRRAVNHRIRRAGLARSDWFGSAADYEYALKEGSLPAGSSVEVMVHPSWDGEGELIDATTARRFSDMPWLRSAAAAGKEVGSSIVT
jgi:predicted glycoside hydrolase/deacetylase ChbG (UPF0249 family)